MFLCYVMRSIVIVVLDLFESNANIFVDNVIIIVVLDLFECNSNIFVLFSFIIYYTINICLKKNLFF